MEQFTIWNDVEGKEQSIQRAFGGTVAAPVWQQFMQYATAGLPPVDFPEAPVGSDVYRVVPRTVVPALDGLNAEQMADAVYGAGLRLDRIEVASSTPEGRIVRIVPRSGTALRQGSTVSVLVSSGEPEPAALPDLIGRTLSEVTAALNAFRQENDIRVDWTVEYADIADSTRWGIVVATNPSTGSVVADGGTIKVVVGRQPGG